MERENIDLEYPVMGPYLDTSVPEVALNPGSFGYLAGTDPRFKGGLTSFPGLAYLRDAGSMTKITHFRVVSFAGKGLNAVYWGYLYCIGDGVLSLATTTGGAYSTVTVYSSGITDSSKIDCYASKDVLYVVSDLLEPKACYTKEGVVTVRTMGPGDTFGDPDNVTAPEEGTTTASEDHYLGQGSDYQVAYRFYDSVGGIYSALSEPYTLSIPADTEDTDATYSVVFTLPAGVSGATAIFDTVEWFRTIPLTGPGAIFYMERSDTLSLAGEYIMGTMLDNALIMQDSYDANTDIVKPCPKGGAIGSYEGYTFISNPTNDKGGYGISHSDITKDSEEYFSTYNERKGNVEEGRPLRFVRAGDYMLIMQQNSIIHVAKIGTHRTLQYRVIHFNRGLVNPMAVHAAGGSVFFICQLGLVVCDANTGDMQQVTATDRIILERWAGDMSVLEMGYDSDMNATFIFNPTKAEALLLGHTVQAPMMLENLPFAHMSEGMSHVEQDKSKVYFITNSGKICYPDASANPSGNMAGLDGDTYSLSGTGSITGDTITVDAGFSVPTTALCAGYRVYITNGLTPGQYKTIDSSGSGTIVVTSAFSSNETDITWAIAPIVFKARFWSIASHMQKIYKQSTFARYILKGMSLKTSKTQGASSVSANKWITGVYRNGSNTLENIDSALEVVDNTSDCVVDKQIDGIDIEPFVCQIGSNISFNLISICNNIIMTNSRKIKET